MFARQQTTSSDIRLHLWHIVDNLNFIEIIFGGIASEELKYSSFWAISGTLSSNERKIFKQTLRHVTKCPDVTTEIRI